MQVFCYLQQQNSKAHQFSTWPKKTGSLFTFPVTNLKSFLPLDYMPASYHCYLLWLTRSICHSTCSCLYNQSWTASLLHTGTRSTTGCHTEHVALQVVTHIQASRKNVMPLDMRKPICSQVIRDSHSAEPLGVLAKFGVQPLAAHFHLNMPTYTF